LILISQTASSGWIGAVLCGCGLALAIWARLILGRNWSGVVTLKEDHELVQRGPYGFVRHPIYTGLQGMLLGTAIAFGRHAAFIAVSLVFVSFWIKLKPRGTPDVKTISGRVSGLPAASETYYSLFALAKS
jgi:protein-S-isoprenylcysteine O-methyltransferase Ste14